MVPMDLSFSVLLGTHPEPTTRTLRLAEGESSNTFPTNRVCLFIVWGIFSNYATMRFEPESVHGANSGLDVARQLLEKVKQEFSWISYGDLWTLAGVAAVQEMAGPHIPWRPGRIDGFSHQATPDGRLPDATQGSDHLRNVFYRMGFVKKVLNFHFYGN